MKMMGSLLPAPKKLKAVAATADTLLQLLQQQTSWIEYNYNLATAKILSIQRMILDNKHKLYDIEFSLAAASSLSSQEEIGVWTARCRS